MTTLFPFLILIYSIITINTQEQQQQPTQTLPNNYADSPLIDPKKSEIHIFKKFEEFKIRFNKNYTTFEENAERFEIFKQNYLTMLSYRDKNTGSDVLGITEYMDIPQRQFLRIYFRNPVVIPKDSDNEGEVWNETIPQILNLQDFDGQGELYYETEQSKKESTTDTDVDETELQIQQQTMQLRNLQMIPNVYDWRTQGVVSSVKDQGLCGGCWSFAALVAVEGAYARKYKKLYSFSPQQIIDCNQYNYGCSGGTIAAALSYLKSYPAQPLSSYPYKQYRQTCKYNYKLGIAKVSSYYYSSSSNEENIKAMLYNGGPLAININATPLQYYKGGIFNPTTCSNSVNHGVALVGYGYSNGVPYWIVKNSWGSNWGEGGYFRIYRGKKLCGMTSTVIAAKVV